MENNTIAINKKNQELNNTVIDSLKFLEQLLGNIISHTESTYSNVEVEQEQCNSTADFSQYVTSKLQGVLQLFKTNGTENYCDIIAKTANNETFSINDLVAQFKQIKWLTQGYHLIENKLVGSQNFEQGIHAINNVLAQHLTCNLVAFYVLTNNDSCKLVHHLSEQKDINLPKTIAQGTGILGDLLATNNTYFGATPTELIAENNNSWLPAYICCVPILMSNELEGVLLLGKDSGFTNDEARFITLCQTHLAAYLVYNRTKDQLTVMQNTLATQTEKLNSQSEELSTQKETLLYNRSRAEALEKKTLSLSDALNQKTQLIELLEGRIQEFTNNLSQSVKASANAEKIFALKEQEFVKTTEKYNLLEKQLLEKTQRAETIYEKLISAEKTIALQITQIETANTELYQTQSMLKRQTESLNAANARADYLKYLAHALKLIVNEHFAADNEPANAGGGVKNTSQAKAALLQLVADTEELSNIQNNLVAVKIAPAALSEIFSALKQQFANAAISKGIAFSIEQNNEICNYQKIDAHKLHKILHGLLAYSFKHTDIGAISVKAYQPDYITNKNVFAISISDTGVGMSAERQKTIFIPFDHTNIDKHNDAGLTLKLVYEYAKLLGAELNVQSQEGLGTTFTLYLPIANCSPVELHNTYSHENTNLANNTINISGKDMVNPLQQEPIISESGEQNTASQAILIMHDELTYKNINKILSTVVKTTELVTTADMAYKKIRAQDFNCIIMSLQHPDLPGFKWIMTQLKRDGLNIPKCVLYVPHAMNTRENELAKKYTRDYGVKFAKNTDELLEYVIQNLCVPMN